MNQLKAADSTDTTPVRSSNTIMYRVECELLIQFESSLNTGTKLELKSIECKLKFMHEMLHAS